MGASSSRLLEFGLGDDARGLAGHRNGVAWAQLPASAGFDVVVHRDRARRELGLGIRTAVDQIGELHELSESDRLIPNRDIPNRFRHGRQASALASRP
jgi:hypothetical protein